MRCLFFTALQGNDYWRVTYTSSDVCALRGSTVEISCTYRYPEKRYGRDTTVQETLWFTKRDRDEYVDLRRDADYADRVEYSCGENRCTRNSYSFWYSYNCYGKCTLRIRDLRLSDSAEYKFQFITNQPAGKYTGDPGVTLSVTGKLWLLMSLLNILWMCLKVFIIIIIIVIYLFESLLCNLLSHQISRWKCPFLTLPVLKGQSWNVTVCVV